MIKAFQDGEDIHASTAAKLFKIPLAEVSKTQRSQAKNRKLWNYLWTRSFCFGRTNRIIPYRSQTDDRSLLETYPKLKEYMAEQVNKARQVGYVETILGRNVI